MADWATPGTVSDLRSFLGFASYYRHFAQGFAKLAAPLHKVVAELAGTKNLPGKGIALMHARTSQCENSFRELKESSPMLTPDYLSF